jgi:hypothetical protein
MKICKIKWSENYDETKVIFTNEFNEAHRIVQLDVLQDAIGILEETYNTILKNLYTK